MRLLQACNPGMLPAHSAASVQADAATSTAQRLTSRRTPSTTPNYLLLQDLTNPQSTMTHLQAQPLDHPKLLPHVEGAARPHRVPAAAPRPKFPKLQLHPEAGVQLPLCERGGGQLATARVRAGLSRGSVKRPAASLTHQRLQTAALCCHIPANRAPGMLCFLPLAISPSLPRHLPYRASLRSCSSPPAPAPPRAPAAASSCRHSRRSRRSGAACLAASVPGRQQRDAWLGLAAARPGITHAAHRQARL